MSTTSQNSASSRISALLDDNSFVEIGQAVTARTTDFNMTEKKAPSDGVITGYGVIDGSLVYVYSQDASVLNGTVGEMHAKKIAKIYDLALKVGAPVIGLVDCAAVRAGHAVFIGAAAFCIDRDGLPHAAVRDTLHRQVFLVPEVEIARHAHRLRLRRPGPEHESVNTVPILRVTAEKPVGV